MLIKELIVCRLECVDQGYHNSVGKMIEDRI